VITIGIIVAECLVILIMVGRLTGRKVFDPRLFSGLIRLSLGVFFILLFNMANEAYLRRWGHRCCALDMLGFQYAVLLAGAVLIPAGVLQTSYLLFKRLYSRVRARGNTNHT